MKPIFDFWNSLFQIVSITSTIQYRLYSVIKFYHVIRRCAVILDLSNLIVFLIPVWNFAEKVHFGLLNSCYHVSDVFSFLLIAAYLLKVIFCDWPIKRRVDHTDDSRSLMSKHKRLFTPSLYSDQNNKIGFFGTGENENLEWEFFYFAFLSWIYHPFRLIVSFYDLRYWLNYYCKSSELFK